MKNTTKTEIFGFIIISLKNLAKKDKKTPIPKTNDLVAMVVMVAMVDL